jgi:rod shape-determining protein MreB
MFGFFRDLNRFWSRDLALDLGTNTIRMYENPGGVVLCEPAVVAVKQGGRDDGRVLAVGARAKSMLGRAPAGISVLRPLQDGVIADFRTLESILRHFISQVSSARRFNRPRLVVSVPLGVTPVEKRAVRDCAMAAGAREVFIMEELLAAAIGAGLPVAEATCSLIMDFGAGATEAATISLGGIVDFQSARAGGNHLDAAIAQFIRHRHHLLIGEETAERIKMELLAVHPAEESRTMAVKGLDLATGLPHTQEFATEDLKPAAAELVGTMTGTVLEVLERCPPELSSDLLERGLVLTGGGALLRGVDRILREATHLPVTVVDDPMTTVVRGLGRVLENPDLAGLGQAVP